MSPIYSILKGIKIKRPRQLLNHISRIQKFNNMNFQFSNRTSPSLLEEINDRNELITRIENLQRLSNVYQLLTMGQQLPSQRLLAQSHSGLSYISYGTGRSYIVPVPRETVSHKESLSSDRSSKSPKSENGSESSK